MRQAMVALGLWALAGCAAAPVGNYDPRLYDANGNVVTAVAPPPAVPAPQPQAAAPAPECHDAQRTVVIGGQPHTALARACRQSDGSWRFVE
jgi:surface antigen